MKLHEIWRSRNIILMIFKFLVLHGVKLYFGSYTDPLLYFRYSKRQPSLVISTPGTALDFLAHVMVSCTGNHNRLALSRTRTVPFVCIRPRASESSGVKRLIISGRGIWDNDERLNLILIPVVNTH